MTPAHTKEDFEIFMSQLKETNATLAFYSDFKKIAKNVDEILEFCSDDNGDTSR